MQGQRTIRVAIGGEGCKAILLYPSMQVDEISFLINSIFGTNSDVFGFEDFRSNSLFSLNCVAADPSILVENAVYNAVLLPKQVHELQDSDSDEEDENVDDINAAGVPSDITEFSASHSEAIRQRLPNLTYIGEATGLSSMSAKDVFVRFQQNASNGSLGRNAFQECFRDLFDHKRSSSSSRCNDFDMKRIVNSLFDTFDVDGNGFVDMNELASGLVVLCGGKDEDRIRVAFNLYDVNKDGYISKHEMQDYLISAFRVIFSTSGSGKLRSVISPEDLAKATTDDCFRKAAKTNDQLLSFEEFKRWYEGDSSLAVSVDVEVTILDIVKMLGVDNVSVMKLLQILSESGQFLTSTSAQVAFQRLKSTFNLNSNQFKPGVDTPQIIENFFSALFGYQDVVTAAELVSGFCPFCQGNLVQSVMDGLSFFDDDGDGFVDRQEAEGFLRSFYSVLIALQKAQQCQLHDDDDGVRQAVSSDPRTTALVAATDAFRHHDVDHTGVVSRYDFACWFTATIATAYGICPSPDNDDGDAPSYSFLPSAPSLSSSPSTMRILRQQQEQEVENCFLPVPHPLADFIHGILYLGDRRVDSTICAFHARCQSDQMQITLPLFVQILVGQLASIRSQARVCKTDKLFIEHLFQLLDSDGDKKISIRDLSNRLNVFRSEDHTIRLVSAIELYDFDGDGMVLKRDLFNFQCALSSVLECVSTPAQSYISESGASIEQLSGLIVDQIFVDSGLVDCVPIACVVDWYVSHCYNGLDDSPPQSLPPSSTGHGMNFDIPSCANIRGALKLSDSTPELIVSTFRKYAQGKLTVTMQEFGLCLNVIAQTVGQALPPTAAVSRLFTVFDTDGDCEVNLIDVLSGLIYMCGGREKAKLICGLSIRDLDGDGKLSLKDVMDYLTIVNVVRRDLDCNDLAGYAPEYVARGTAVNAFTHYSRRLDSYLTIEEAIVFLSTDRRDSISMAQNDDDRKNFMRMTSAFSQADANVANDFPSSRSGPLWSSNAVRAKFGLSGCSFNRAISLMSANSSHGDISRQGFVAAVLKLCKECRGSCTTANAQALFDAFDDNGDDLVSVAELISSFTLLVGDQRVADKASYAFDIYDADHDNLLTRSELRDFLMCIYKTLFALQPNLSSMSNIDPSVLANETSERIFHDYESSVREGKLSKQGFSNWFESDMSQSEDGSAGEPEEVETEEADEIQVLPGIVDNFGLTSMTLGSLHEALVSLSGPSGSMSRDAFVSFLTGISYRFCKSHAGGNLLETANVIFSVVAGNNTAAQVDVGLLSSALGVIVGSSKHDKIENIVRHLNSASTKRLSVIYTQSSDLSDAEISSRRVRDVIRGVVGVLKVFRLQDSSGSAVEAENLTSKLFADSSSFNVVRLSAAKVWISANFGLLTNQSSCNDEKCPAYDHLSIQEKYSARPASRQSARPIRELLFPMGHSDNNIPVRSDDEHQTTRKDRSVSFNVSSVNDLMSAQTVLGLDVLSCAEVVDTVMEKFPRGSYLNFKQWTMLSSLLRRLTDAKHSPMCGVLERKIFDAFDCDIVDKVNSVDFAAGLASLTNSSAEDKIVTAFQLFDTDNDGCLTFGQFYDYMNASMLVSCACSGSGMQSSEDSVEFRMKCDRCTAIAFSACRHFFQSHNIDENDVVNVDAVSMFAEQCMNLARSNK